MKKLLLFLLGMSIFLFSIMSASAIVYVTTANCTTVPTSSVGCDENLTFSCYITTNIPDGIDRIVMYVDGPREIRSPSSGTRTAGTWNYTIGPFVPEDGSASIYGFNTVYIYSREIGGEEKICQNRDQPGTMISGSCVIDWTPETGSSIDNDCSCTDPVRSQQACEFDSTGTSSLGGYAWVNWTVPYSGCDTNEPFQVECTPCEADFLGYYGACNGVMLVSWEPSDAGCCEELGELCTRQIPSTVSLACSKDTYYDYMEIDQSGVSEIVALLPENDTFVLDNAPFSFANYDNFDYSAIIDTPNSYQPIIGDFDLDGFIDVIAVSEDLSTINRYTYYQTNLTLESTATLTGASAGQFAFTDTYSVSGSAGAVLVPVINSSGNFVCSYTTAAFTSIGCVDVGVNKSINNSGIICNDDYCYIKGNDDGVHYATRLALTSSAITYSSTLALTSNSTGGENIGWDEDNENVPVIGNFYQASGDNEVIFAVPVNNSGTKVYVPIPVTTELTVANNYIYPPPYVLNDDLPTSFNGQPIVADGESGSGDWAVSQEVGTTLELLRLRVNSLSTQVSITLGNLTGGQQYQSSNAIGSVGNIVCKNDVKCFATLFPASCTGRNIYTNYACSNYSSYVYEWNGDSWINTGAYGEYIFEDYGGDYFYGIDRGEDKYFRTTDGVSFTYFTNANGYEHPPPRRTWGAYAGQVCENSYMGSPGKFIDCDDNGVCYAMTFLNSSYWRVSYTDDLGDKVWDGDSYAKTQVEYSDGPFSGAFSGIVDVNLLYDGTNVLLFELKQSSSAGPPVTSDIRIYARNSTSGTYILRYTLDGAVNEPWYFPGYHSASYDNDQLTLGTYRKNPSDSNCYTDLKAYDVAADGSSITNTYARSCTGSTGAVGIVNVNYDVDEDKVYFSGVCAGTANVSSGKFYSIDSTDFFDSTTWTLTLEDTFATSFHRAYAGNNFVMYPTSTLSRYTRTDLVTTVWDQFMNTPSLSYLEDYDVIGDTTTYSSLAHIASGSSKQPLIYNLDGSIDNSKEYIVLKNGIKVYDSTTYDLVDEAVYTGVLSEGVVCDYDRDSTSDVIAIFNDEGVASLNSYTYDGNSLIETVLDSDIDTTYLGFTNILCENLDDDADVEIAFKDYYGNFYVYEDGALTKEVPTSLSHIGDSNVYNALMPSNMVSLSDWGGKRAIAYPVITKLSDDVEGTLTRDDEVTIFVRDEDGIWYYDVRTYEDQFNPNWFINTNYYYLTDPASLNIVSDGVNQFWVTFGVKLSNQINDGGDIRTGTVNRLEEISDFSEEEDWPAGFIVGYSNSSGDMIQIFDLDITPTAHTDGTRNVKYINVPTPFYYEDTSGVCLDGCIGFFNTEVSSEVSVTSSSTPVYGYNLKLYDGDDNTVQVNSVAFPESYGSTISDNIDYQYNSGLPIVFDEDSDSDLDVVFAPCIASTSSNGYLCDDGIMVFDVLTDSYENIVFDMAQGIAPVVVDITNDGEIDFITSSSNAKTTVYKSSAAGSSTFDFNTTIDVTSKTLCTGCSASATITNPILGLYNNIEVYGVGVYALSNLKNQIYLFDTDNMDTKRVIKTNTGLETGKFMSGFDTDDDETTDYILAQGIFNPNKAIGNEEVASLLSGSSSTSWFLPVNLDSNEYADIFYTGTDDSGSYVSVLPVQTVRICSEADVTAYCSLVGDNALSVSATACAPNPDNTYFTYHIDDKDQNKNKLVKDIDESFYGYIYTFPEILNLPVGDRQATIRLKERFTNKTLAVDSCTVKVVEEKRQSRCGWVNEFFYTADLRDKGWDYLGLTGLRPDGDEVPLGEVRVRSRTSDQNVYLWVPDVDCYYSTFNVELGMRVSPTSDIKFQVYGEWLEDETRYWDKNVLGYIRFKDGLIYTKVGDQEVSKGSISSYVDNDGVMRLILTFNTITETMSILSSSNQSFSYDDINEPSSLVYTDTIVDAVPYVDRVRDQAGTLQVTPFKELNFLVNDGYMDLLYVHTYARGGLLDGDKYLEIDPGIALLQVCDVSEYCSQEWGESVLAGWGRYCDVSQLKDIVRHTPTKYEGSCFKEALDYCTKITYQVEALDVDEDKIGGKYDFTGNIGEMKEEAVTYCSTALTLSATGSKVFAPILSQFFTLMKDAWLLSFAVIILSFLGFMIYIKK